MDFFNSLSQVAKNQNNFKKWEAHQHDEEAQREELARRRQHTPEELKQAEEFGKTIIDVVDIMDNHSENVAENVETAVDPLSSISTLITFFGGNWLVGKHKSQKLLNKIREIELNAINAQEGQNLTKRLKDYEHLNPQKRWFYSDSILRKNQIKRVKDTQLKKDLLNYYGKVEKQTGKLTKQIWWNHGLVALASIGVFIASTILEAKLQTDSSKIARYQARRELDDPKAFVNYTPEQIAAAKKELEEHPELLKEKKKSKLKSGMIKSIYNIIKDNRAYRKDKKAREDNSQIVTRDLTPEELKQAQRDKEVIQRVVRIINNEAEKNSENMEVAANVIIGATPVLGATVGAATGWILNKVGVLDKFVENSIDRYGSEETKQLFENLKKSKKTGFAYLKQWLNFSDSLMRSDNTVNQATKSKKIKFNEIVKKLFASGFSHKSGKNWILGGIGSLVTGFAGMIIGLKLQKSAARAGRYTAKRELEKNPENFIGYTPEDYEEVKDIKIDKEKKVITSKDEYICDYVIIATGRRPKLLGVTGEDELRTKGISYCAVCDGALYKNKDVVVVGASDAAFEGAIYLSKLASSVTVLYRNKFRAKVYLQEMIKKIDNISFVRGEVESFSKDDKIIIKTKEGNDIIADGVFIYIGQIPNANFLSSLNILDDKGYIKTDNNLMTSIDGVYAVGDALNKYDYQIVIAMGEAARVALEISRR